MDLIRLTIVILFIIIIVPSIYLSLKDVKNNSTDIDTAMICFIKSMTFHISSILKLK